MIETNRLSSIFDWIESKKTERKHRQIRWNQRDCCKSNVKHDEEFDSTLSADDDISCRSFRSYEDNSNWETSNQISFIAVISECQKFWKLRSNMTADVNVFHANRRQQNSTTTEWHVKDVQVSIHQKSTIDMTDVQWCNSNRDRKSHEK